MKGKACFCVVLFLWCSVWTVASTRRALVFGLGQQEDTRWRRIHGDKDVELVVQMLVEGGFTDIRTLMNERATKAGMEQAFMGLISRLERGDVVYVHYSGHGQFMTDVDGDEADRWTGRHAQWDEAWIPYDAYMTYCERDRGEKHFCDDEVARYMQQVRQKVGAEGEVYVVVDACHSGDATRGVDDECVRGVDVEFMIPRQFGTEPAKAVAETWLTVSACKPYQLCFEHKSPQVGKLTYALYRLGERLFSMTNGELQAWLDGYMDANPSRLPQNPVVSGKRCLREKRK